MHIKPFISNLANTAQIHVHHATVSVTQQAQHSFPSINHNDDYCDISFESQIIVIVQIFLSIFTLFMRCIHFINLCNHGESNVS